MTPEQAVIELIAEIKTERIAAERRHIETSDRLNAIERRLTVIEARSEDAVVAIGVLAKDLHDFRDLVFEGEANLLERVRQVSDFAGMTDPHDGNGNGGE